ncbi:hypothetical protein D3C78_1586360 [compost metagenome]
MGVTLQVSTLDQRYLPWGEKLVLPRGLARGKGTFLVADPDAFGPCGLASGTDRKEVTILWP